MLKKRYIVSIVMEPVVDGFTPRNGLAAFSEDVMAYSEQEAIFIAGLKHQSNNVPAFGYSTQPVRYVFNIVENPHIGDMAK